MLKWIVGISALVLLSAGVAPAGTAQAVVDPRDVPFFCSGTYDRIINLNETPGVQGTGLREIFVGTEGNDVINAGAGNDCIVGNGGNDVINGGAGNDVVIGSDGYDKVDGGSGIDRCAGESRSSCEGDAPNFGFGYT